MLKAKLQAAGWHGLITIAVAGLTAYLVFAVWYPGPLSAMAAGSNLYKIIVMAEIVLGPVISLVIYNTTKGKRELFFDYLCVGTIQVAALAYGLYAVAISRPVYLVFVGDRIEVVAHAELTPDDRSAGGITLGSLPWFGPELICVEGPTDPDEQFNLLFSALGGKDIHLIPKYYRSCEDGEIERQMRPLDELSKPLPEILQGLDAPLYWLPIVARTEYWTAVFPNKNLDDATYVNFDPY